MRRLRASVASLRCFGRSTSPARPRRTTPQQVGDLLPWIAVGDPSRIGVDVGFRCAPTPLSGHHAGRWSPSSARSSPSTRSATCTAIAGYPRFFAEVSLFVFSMTMLVLADNFLLLYRRLGRRRPVQLPADRLLVHEAVGGRRGPQGVPGHAHRRRGLVARHLPALGHASATTSITSTSVRQPREVAAGRHAY